MSGGQCTAMRTSLVSVGPRWRSLGENVAVGSTMYLSIDRGGSDICDWQTATGLFFIETLLKITHCSASIRGVLSDILSAVSVMACLAVKGPNFSYFSRSASEAGTRSTPRIPIPHTFLRITPVTL